MQQLFFTSIKASKPLILCVFLLLVACSVNLQSKVPTQDEQNIPTLSLTVSILPVESSTPVPVTKSTATSSLSTLTSTLDISQGVETQAPLDEPTITQVMMVSEYPPGPIIIPTINEIPLGLYLFSPLVVYQLIEKKENDFTQPSVIDGLTLPLGSQNGPAQGYDLSFSNHSNLMAYWPLGYPSELFISDLSNQIQHLIFTDIDQAYGIGDRDDVRLMWSSDDMHLIVDVKNGVELDFIYHLQTGMVEVWPYDCDRIALSPKSGKMTTWCASITEATKFAVLEWGGEIWYSQEPPANELVRRKVPPVRLGQEEKPLVWGWSPSGEKIAFYDPEDLLGNLYIANANGDIQISIPGKAYWLVENDPVGLPPYNSIQWSFSENRLLIYGAGDENHSCPQWINIFDESPVKKSVPCWQVIDVSNGETLWTVSDSVDGIVYPADISFAQNLIFNNASLSPDGNYLALFSHVGGANNLNIIDIESHKVLRGWDFYVQSMRWGNGP